jgi:hypothetical protein
MSCLDEALQQLATARDMLTGLLDILKIEPTLSVMEAIEEWGSNYLGLTRQLQRHFVRHVFPPTGIGSTRSSVSHKLHAVMHSMFLDLGSWDAVARTAVVHCSGALFM